MLPRYLNRSIMDNSVLSLIMFEIDKLDETKNRHGHATWENLIRTVGHSMLENGRATDLMVHDQDERFVIILPNSDLNDARMVSRRLREKIGKTILVAPDKRPLSAITLSVGIVELKEAIAETAFLEKAAELMQQAKRVGGDWVSELPIHSSSLGIPLQAG
jgi:diguanylate cyclase (GGDEF)-like protein